MAEWSFKALGTQWWLESPQPLANQAEILAVVRQFEDDYSRFNPSSLLSQLNDKHELLSPPPEMQAMLQYGLDMYSQTGGVFNMSVGAQLEKTGYGRVAPAGARVSENLLQDVQLTSQKITLAPHVRLDFGGFGKGWLVDKLAAMVDGPVIVNGGGDIYVKGPRQSLLIEHPLTAGQAIGSVAVGDESLCSSSRQKRVWRDAKGQEQSHIPGRSNLLSVHVRAESALVADTLGTVFLLVERPKRLELAAQFNAEILEITQDLDFWQTPGFGLEPFRS